MKKRIELDQGLVEISTLWNGQLVLAECTGGSVSVYEIREALKATGIIFGLLEDNIEMLADGFEGQIPVARAHVLNEVGSLWYHFEQSVNRQILLQWMKKEQIEPIDLSCPVSREDRLVTLSAPPKQILKYPNGRVTVLRKLETDSILFYAGENTEQGMHKQSLVSKIDGYANHNLYGVVSVHPMRRLKRIGKMHGAMHFGKALTVEEDIQRESELEVQSNLIVKGMIWSSQIYAGGNLQCELGADGNGDYEKSHIRVGQTLFSSMIRNFKVWTGVQLLVKSSIKDSDIECMDTVFAGNINGSDLRVGNKLYVRDNISDSTVQLGFSFVHDPDLEQQRQLFVQKRKGLADLIKEALNQKNDLERRQAHSVAHIHKLKQNAQNGFSADGLLNMQYRTLKTGSQQLAKKIVVLEKELEEFRKLNMAMSIDESNPYERYEPEIIVGGEVGPGVTIQGPGGRLENANNLKHVSIKMDPTTGTFEVKPLKLNR